MNVQQVREIAKEWVELYASQTPGFLGAHLLGSINTMPLDAPFPSYRDVDMHVVLDRGQKADRQEVLYKGVILEVPFYSVEDYASPELVLSDPGIAPDLTVDSILVDPVGMLAALHRVVAKEYTRRKWVIARCAAEKKQALGQLSRWDQTASPRAGAPHVQTAWFLAGLIAVACLRPTTHRRCLILLSSLLREQGRLDLHEALLGKLGYDRLSRAQTEFHLAKCAAAFDRAVEVYRTPFPYGFKIRSCLRPYIVEASQEMIDEGSHREAMLWIESFSGLSNRAIQNDAPEEEKPRFQAQLDRLLDDLGWNEPGAWQRRRQETEKLAEQFFQLADSIVERNPLVKD